MIRPSLVVFVTALLATGLATGLTSSLFAGEHGISMQASIPWHDPNGYTPVVVTVEATREVDLSLRIAADGGGAAAMIRVSEGRPARQTILLPPTNRDYVRYHVVEWNGPAGISGNTPISRSGNDQIRVALIDPKQQVIEADLEKALGKASGSSSRADVVSRIQPEDLPDRWQGYPEWLILVLTPSGDAGLDEAQRQAITAWTQGGGALVVTTMDLAKAWSARKTLVSVDPLTGTPDAVTNLLNENGDPDRWQPFSAPVPGTETVPVKTFVFLALAFAIVVGPLNLWWVRRRNARHLFLITTPLLSFVTCVVLIVASLLADGVSIKRDAVQVCYLDHRTQQAIRWTGCTYFAAFSRSQMELDPQAKIRVLDREEYSYSHRRSRGEGEHLHLDWRNGQFLSGSVLPARLNRQLSYTEHLPERRRLVVNRLAEGYQLVNGLGVGLVSVAWRDSDGRLWHGDNVAPGETVTLSKQAERDEKKLSGNSTMIAGKVLPNSVAGRLGREVGPLFQRTITKPLTFSAVLSAPMDALPGPSGDDPKPPEAMVFGHLPLSTTGVEGEK